MFDLDKVLRCPPGKYYCINRIVECIIYILQWDANKD